MRNIAQPAARRGSAKLRLKLLATLAVTGLIMAGGTGESHATTANVIKLHKHFVECLNWMLTDPAKHKKFCGPSRIPTSLATMSSSGGGTPPVVVIPEPEEPDPEDCYEGPEGRVTKGGWKHKNDDEEEETGSRFSQHSYDTEKDRRGPSFGSFKDDDENTGKPGKSEKSGGPSEKSGGPSEKSGGPSEKSGGPSEKSGGPSEKSGGPSEKSGGPSEKSGGPSEKSGGKSGGEKSGPSGFTKPQDEGGKRRP